MLWEWYATTWRPFDVCDGGEGYVWMHDVASDYIPGVRMAEQRKGALMWSRPGLFNAPPGPPFAHQ